MSYPSRRVDAVQLLYMRTLRKRVSARRGGKPVGYQGSGVGFKFNLNLDLILRLLAALVALHLKIRHTIYVLVLGKRDPD